jgi:serine protease AprX
VRKREDFDKMVQANVSGVTYGADDAYGHGTLVAGVVGGKSKDGRYVGVAPGTKIYSLNVNGPNGVRSSDVINALQWVFNNAHDSNIRVVNLSLQETVTSSYQMSLLDLAVERVWAAGIAVVVSAGNVAPGGVDYAPANDPLALTVGATDNADTLTTADDTVAAFSSSGTTTDGFVKPELLAPGRHVVSTLPLDTTLGQQAPASNWAAPGYASISGTSFAAPQASAAAAILFQQHPDWSPDNVKWVLTRLAQPMPGSAAGALSVSAATSYSSAPGLANQGVPALVCAPNTQCVVAGTAGTVSSSWNSSSWNSSSWNSSSWNSSSWNSSSWNSSSWNSSSWNSSSWNSSSWNSSSWNSSSWNSTSWN